MASKPKRAALYLRVSTDEQTVDNQRLALEAVCEQRGWQVVQVYSDNGISGAKGRNQRPGLDALLKDASRGRFDVVLAWALRSARPLAAGPARHARRVGGGRRCAGPAPAGDRHYHAGRADVLSGDRGLCRVRAGDDPQPRQGGPGTRQGPRGALGRPKRAPRWKRPYAPVWRRERASRRSRRRSASAMARCRGSRSQWGPDRRCHQTAGRPNCRNRNCPGCRHTGLASRGAA